MRTYTDRTRSKWWEGIAGMLLMVSLLMLGGCSSNDSSSPPPTLYGPENVVAAAQTSGSAVVSWTSITGVTNYNIYYGNANPVDIATAAKTSCSGTSCTVTGLDYLKTYYVAVTAMYGTAESLASDTASVKLPPTAPEGVSAVLKTSITPSVVVDISWANVTGSTAYPITYNVYRSTGTPVATVTPLMSNAASPYTDATVLYDGTRYYYAVTAKGPGGESAPSAEVGVLPFIPTGAPQNVGVIRTPEVTLSATLSWATPTTGAADSYKIYRATTAGTAYAPANLVTTVSGTTFQHIDNSGLLGNTTYYWAVSAYKNIGPTEAAASEVSIKVIGPPTGGGGGDTGFGNNFAKALIFADGVGIGGAALATGSTWTTDVASIDFNTGLRPLSTEVSLQTMTTLPILLPDDIFMLNAGEYYMQQTASTWQGEWVNGSSELQEVTATWGDNLISQSLSENSVIRIEMVLSKPVTTAMTSYTMQSLYGTREGEMQGTDGITYTTTTAAVFAANAHLKIQKMVNGVEDGLPLYDQTLWAGDGPGFLAGEVNVSGGFTYGFVWSLNKEVLPVDITSGKTGTWRLTFSLDPQAPAPVNTLNNTSIIAAPNSGGFSATDAWIDITVQ